MAADWRRLFPDVECRDPARLHLGPGSRLLHHTQYRDRALDRGAPDRTFQGDWLSADAPLWHQPSWQHPRRSGDGLLQYHFTQFGAIQPYVGAGVGYGLLFGNISDGILTNFSVDQNFGLVLQAGADYMLTENWGVFVDGKKLFYSTDGQGLVVRPGTFVRVRSHLQLDPWVATVGITFKY